MAAHLTGFYAYVGQHSLGLPEKWDVERVEMDLQRDLLIRPDGKRG